MLLARQRSGKARPRLVGIGAPVASALPVLATGLFIGPIPPLPPPDISILATPVQQVTSVLPTLPVTVNATLPAVNATAPAVVPDGGVVPGSAPQTNGPPRAAGTEPAPTSSAPGAPAPTPNDGARRGIPIPFTTIVVSSPLDIALLGAIATLPLLLAIWLFLVVRTLVEARRARDSQVRITLAADLGLRPRDLTSLTTKALFKLREKSAFDELTGTLRRAAGISMAERELSRAHRHHNPLTAAFVDVDGLKKANDRKGHATGDKLLRGVAEALKNGLRGQDLLLRYGGDEFICVLPDTTAQAARAKLRSVQTQAARAGMRFSFGLAEMERGDDIVSLLARADRELYEFKAKRGEIVQLPPTETAGKRKQRRVSA
jgi:diguanylate cyclase (GGDEF)-like protein